MTEPFGNPDPNTVQDPTLPSDILLSRQHQVVFDLLGEGEIEGFPSAVGFTKGTTNYNRAAMKDVFLNGTQVHNQSADVTNLQPSDVNFQNVGFEPRFGTSDQTKANGISEVETEFNVGTIVTQSTPVNVTISDTDVDAVRITLGFPQLQEFKDNGDIDGAEVAITIQTIENDGTVTTPITDTVKGRASSTYFRDYKVFLPSGVSFPVVIRVNRVTADSTEATLNNVFAFSRYTEIKQADNKYPNSAYVALRYDAETFPNQPRRMYRVRGTKIKIPHNGTVQSDGSISYSGTFNGTLKSTKEWTNDPAWILYDLLTTSKGFGDQISESQLDIFSFYSASVYCAEQVDDGSGTNSTEPRFSTNVVIQNQKQAYNLINDLCSVMRVMPFYSAGSITITQDRPTDASYLFNLSNVTADGFNYVNTAKTTKTTVVNVAFFDNETQDIQYETVEDTALQAKYGVVTKNLRGFATTSRGQARRLGKWFLYTQSNEAEVVNFITTLDAGVIVRPGNVINIQDPMRAGVRRGGRIKTGVSTTQVIVDNSSDTDLTSASAATLSVILPNGTLETKPISSISGGTITVSSAFSAVPQTNAAWVLENTLIELQTFRVVGVTEVEKMAYQITAVAHNPNKYNIIEDGATFPPKTTSTLIAIKDPPSDLSATETIIIKEAKAISKLFITWQPVSGVKEYEVQYRFQKGNFITLRTKSPDFTILNNLAGQYEVRVFSINSLDKPSTQPTEAIFNTIGKTEPPEKPTNLTLEPLDSQFIKLKFDKSTDTDVLHGGTAIVRHTIDTSTAASFSNATDLAVLAGNATETTVPNLAGTYILMFQDDGGRLSKDEVKIINTKPEAQPKLAIQTRREDADSPPFQGNKVDTFYDPSLDRLLLSGTLEFDSVTDVDALSNFDFSGPMSKSGIYDFATTLDLGSKFTLDLEKHFKVFGILPNDLFDTRTAFIDTWSDFDGATAQNVDAQIFVSTTDTDPSATVSGTYSQSGNVITVTKSSHGYIVGDRVNITFTSGAGVNGSFDILTVPNVNTFTVAPAQIVAEYVFFGNPAGVQITTVKPHPSVGTVLDLTFLTGAGIDGTYEVGFINFVETFGAFSNPSIINSSASQVKKGLVSYVAANASTSGNCTISNKFSKFNKFDNGQFIGRAFQFRTILTSNDPAQNIGIDELGYTASLKPRVENSIENTGATNGVFASGTNTKTVTFQHPFFAGTSDLGGSTSKYLPSIGITLQNAQQGDFFTVHTITGTSFQIDVKNSSGAFANRNFTYVASGFGKGG